MHAAIAEARSATFTRKVADFSPQDSIDLPGVPFGVHTTLGYSENRGDTGGVLTVKNGHQLTKIALLGKLHRRELRQHGETPMTAPGRGAVS